MQFSKFVLLVLGCLVSLAVPQDYTCSPTKPCAIGCCGQVVNGAGTCGLGPTFCGAGNCTSSCDQKSDCDPGWGAQWSKAESCPLNVCCSQYGFCGTTSDFCGTKTVKSPSCSGSSSMGRVIGYYEGWAQNRACYGLMPEQIDYNSYTHLNYAFAFVDPNTFTIAPMLSTDPDTMSSLAALKQVNPGLKVWLSVGGWSMNDADQPTHATFSALANSASAQAAFAKSLLQVLGQYGFDGVDIDWEYPVAEERSGNPSDFQAYPTFLQNLRSSLGSSGHAYGLSITLPSSYWYMQHFDIAKLEKYVDWFNIMTYDLHGTWDSTDRFIGPIVQSHTNLTEIDLAMQLLWRNGIDPAKVSMGLGFYGRSFTLTDPSCTAAGCPFSAGGTPGACSNSAGTLMYSEIQDIINNESPTITFDKDAAVKIAVWNANQWISYDDTDTLKLKVDYANSHCLGGIMVWAASTDDENGSAIAALSGVNGRSKLSIAAVSHKSDPLTQCVWGACGKGGAKCDDGLSPAQRSDGGGGRGNAGIYTGCPKGEQRNFCCPNNHLPTCEWRGTASICAHAGCKDNEVGVASDKCGTGKCCDFNHKNLCCTRTDSDFAEGQCAWEGSAPYCALSNSGEASCPKGRSALTADKQGAGGESVCGDFLGYKSYCCNQPAPFNNCAWSDNGKSYDYWPPLLPYRLVPIGNHVCSGTCPEGQVAIAGDSSSCSKGTTAYFCCDNPTAATNPIPVPDTELCSLSSGLIPESNELDYGDTTYFSELENYDWEADCWVSDETDSGDPDLPIYHDETKRSEFVHNATEVRHQRMDEFDEDVAHLMLRRDVIPEVQYHEEIARLTEKHSWLLKRGPSRTQKLCKNPPGKTRKKVTTSLTSAAYNNLDTLVAAGTTIYYYDKKACGQRVIKTAKKAIPKTVANLRLIVEHVWEIQGVKSFMQSLVDGVKPGNTALTAGQLVWAPFDTTAKASASFFLSWASQGVTLAAGLTGNTPEETFYNILGTAQDSFNNLILEAQANGMKAIVFAGAKSVIGSAKWKTASHKERLGLLQTVRIVFDYMNSADAQASFKYVYGKTQTACVLFQKVLKTTNGVDFDVPAAWKEFATANFAQMTVKVVGWIEKDNSALVNAEVAYWSGINTADAAANLLELRKWIASYNTWTTVGTAWIT